MPEPTPGADLLPYQYVVMRCVPRVEREEFLNVGVVLYCQAADVLEVAWHVAPERVHAMHPDLDLGRLCDALAFVEGVCAGDERGGSADAQASRRINTPARPQGAGQTGTSSTAPTA